MSKLFDYEFANCHCIFLEENFDSEGNDPLKMQLTLTPGIQRVRNVIYEKSWNPSNPFTNEAVVVTERDTAQTQITRISWVHTEDQEEGITEIKTTQKASLIAEISNPEGSTATITIEKEDGTEFESGKKQLSFTEAITGDGLVEITPFEIKEQWEEFKTADMDTLVAKVEHNGVHKKSAALQIVPLPKVLVDFRPAKRYDGAYGLDYLRHKRNKKDNVTYKDIMGTNTGSPSVFTAYPTDTKYNSLKDDHYTTITFPWHTDINGTEIEYPLSWLSIYSGDTQTLSLQVETIDAPDELTLEYDKELFEITPDTIPAQRNGSKKRLDDHLTIKCKGEFDITEKIKVMHGTRQLGQLNVLPNDCDHRYKAKVVFIEVETDLTGNGRTTNGNTTNKGGGTEQDMIRKFLKQAYIKLEEAQVSFNLTANDPTTNQPKYPEFNRDYLTTNKNTASQPKIINKYHNTNGTTMVAYMETIFNAAHPQYTDHYKIFLFGETGGRDKRGGGSVLLAGYAKGFNTKSVAIFAGKTQSTVTHETLHAMGLRHTFDNAATYGYKKKKTMNIMDYATKRNHTWLWQWKKLWAILDKEEAV